MGVRDTFYKLRGKKLEANLKKRNFGCNYFDTKEEARDFILSQIPSGASVSYGGSVSNTEAGLLDALKQRNDIELLDRLSATTEEERVAIEEKAMKADIYLMGNNGISLDGELVNIDGFGNRVAALIYGPKKVFLLTGMNKVGLTLEDAVKRARNEAAPKNAVRLNRNTPCVQTGKCENCLSEECICSHIVITRRTRQPERIHIVLVGEDLGY